MPGSDHRGPEIGQGDRTQRRQDVEAQEALVELGGARAQQRALTQPARGVVGERDGGGVDVDPCPVLDGRSGGGQERVRLPRGRERLRREMLDTPDAVARLEPA